MELVALMLTVCIFGAVQARKLVFEPKSGDNNVPCPDGSACADGDTCCLIDTGYGCCPYPNAECCSDKTHCCPNGYTCDIPHARCVQAFRNRQVPLGLKRRPVASLSDLPSQPSSENLVCPNGGTCQGTAACCKTYSNTYNCCVYPNDVCCDDGLHCCARLTICDQKTLTCIPGANSAPWDKPVPSRPAALAPLNSPKLEKIKIKITSAPNIVCPSGTTCGATSACCRTASGTYNCCVYPYDVCCSDGLHCCSRGMICDVKSLTCLPGKAKVSDRLPWDKPKAAISSV